MSAIATVEILDASVDHLPEIHGIYAHYVLHEPCTFELEPPSVAELASRHAEVRRLGLPFLVARMEGIVVGYAYAGRYRAREAYRHTAESSVYVMRGRHRGGVGKALLHGLIERCADSEVRQLVAVIGDSANLGSIRLHESVGFENVGTLRKVGFKFGRWIDTVLMQREL